MKKFVHEYICIVLLLYWSTGYCFFINKGWLVRSLSKQNWERCCPGDLKCYKKTGVYFHLPLPDCANTRTVHYYLNTQYNKDTGVTFDPKKPILPDVFDASKTIIIYINGYLSRPEGRSGTYAKEKILKSMDVNLIFVDWSSISRTLDYDKAASSTQTVGKYIAINLIDVLVQKHEEISYKNIWCIGFSLGAHVCGIAGRNTKKKIGRITGLDAAGPKFTSYDRSIRLNENSADFVDAYHTDAFNKDKVSFGIKDPVGHADFYYNGAHDQPQCANLALLLSSKTERLIGCSHRRAADYFFETLENPCCHVAHLKCSYENEKLGNCQACAVSTYAYAGIKAENTTCGENGGYRGIFSLNTIKDGDSHCTIFEQSTCPFT